MIRDEVREDLAPLLPGPSAARKTAGLRSKTATLPSLPSEVITPRGFQAEAAAAAALRRRIRDQAFERVRFDLVQRANREVSAEAREKLQALTERFESQTKEILEELRLIFESHARQVGPKRVTLAFLVGFPDPDPGSERQARGKEPEEIRRLREAQQVRSEIAQLEAEYRRSTDDALARLYREFREGIAKLDQENREELGRRTAESEQQAREIVRDSVPKVQETMLDAPKQLPPVSNREVGISSAPSARRQATPIQPASPARYTDERRWEDQKETFLQSRNYRLAQPGEKGKDVTEEFLKWRRQFANGL
ncbi:MAG: hypothetical protein MUC92_00480 [Fimbriimonadaceae bacterium]|nr:hypothetical protein [Fimbriimonadaceae bacterium]